MKFKYRFTDSVDLVSACEQLASDGTSFNFVVKNTDKSLVITGHGFTKSTGRWLDSLVRNKLATIEEVK
jgi:hypothetical protein